MSVENLQEAQNLMKVLIAITALSVIGLIYIQFIIAKKLHGYPKYIGLLPSFFYLGFFLLIEYFGLIGEIDKVGLLPLLFIFSVIPFFLYSAIFWFAYRYLNK